MTGIFFSLVLRLSDNSYFYSTKLDSSVANMSKVLNYIKLHYQDTTLTEVADHFHYSAAYLGKQIKKATGMLYNDLITQLKLQYAMTLLAYSEMKIEAIAEQVGYHSADHFSRTFKKATGSSPQQYRKSNRAQYSELLIGGIQTAHPGSDS